MTDDRVERAASAALLGVLLATATVAAAWPASTADNSASPGTTQPRPDDREAETRAWVDAMIAEQVHALGCTTTRTDDWHDVVATRPAGSNADGVFDTAVVTRTPTDLAWREAERGTLYVVGFC